MTEASAFSRSWVVRGIKPGLILAGLLLTNHQVLSRLQYFLDSESYFALLVFLGIWASALVAIFYIAYTPRYAERWAWSLLIFVGSFLGETYFQIVGERLTMVALDAMWTPELLTGSLVMFYGTQSLTALAFSAVLLLGLVIPLHSVFLLRSRYLAALPLLPLVLLASLIYYVGAANGNQTQAMPSQFHSLSLFAVFTFSDKPSVRKNEVDIPLTALHDLKNIILVVDESVSGDFIDLNVERGTTPYLLSRKNEIANFGLVTSASNCSDASNAIMRLGANPADLGNGEPGILTHPSIWKYAKQAGFETSFVEAQKIAGLHRNFMHASELELIDRVESYSEATPINLRDHEMISQIVEILARSGPQFVYVNKQGAHFPYSLGYPENEAVFMPAMDKYEIISNRERLVNSYKNSIRWAVDHFFKTLLAQVDLSNSVLIYTSDHGQNLLDDGRPVTHCRRSQENGFEAIVPLLVFTNRQDLRDRFQHAAAQNLNRVSQFSVFPTLLHLFGFDTGRVQERYYQDLFETVDEPLGFTSGAIMGRFGRQPRWHSLEETTKLAR